MRKPRAEFLKTSLSRKAFVAGVGAFAATARPAFAQAKPSPIKVGLMFSYSGDNGPAGTQLDAAIAAYTGRYGSQVAGRDVVFVKRDTGQPDPATVKRIAQELIVGDNVSLIMGLAYSPEVLAIGPISTSARMPVFNVNSTTSNILKDSPLISRYAVSNGQLVYPLAQWASEHDIHEIYTVVADYVAGIGMAAGLNRAFTARGGKIVGEIRIPLGEHDFSAYVQRIKDAKPQAIFLFLPAGNGPKYLLRALTDAGIRKTTTILAAGSVVEEDSMDAMGDDALGVISVYNYSMTHDSKVNRQFVADFQRAAGSALRPNYAAIAGYDTVAAVFSVLRAQNGVVDPDKTMELVKAYKTESPRGPISIDPSTRCIVENIYIRRTERAKNGQIVNTEIATYSHVKDPEETY